MNFTYYPPLKDSSEIRQEELRHKYYARLTPDGSQLVQGVLKQDVHPRIGKWIDVGDISRKFSKRYFLQAGSFNTLVPGSLIQGNRLPKGKWKEIKKRSRGAFHRIVFKEGYTYEVDGAISTEYAFTENTEFIPEKMLAPLNAIEPGEYNSLNYATLNFYYFAGSFEELGGDVSQLIPFGAPPAYFSVYYTMFGEYYGMSNTHPSTLGLADLRIQPETPDGVYSFILALRKYDYHTFQEYDAYYIVLENILTKMTQPAD